MRADYKDQWKTNTAALLDEGSLTIMPQAVNVASLALLFMRSGIWWKRDTAAGLGSFSGNVVHSCVCLLCA